MVDHFAMKQAMIDALQQKVSQLQHEANYNSIIAEDNSLLADSLAQSLMLLLSGNYTDQDVEYANTILNIWKKSRNQQ
jgi:hypothetical protein